MDSVLPISDDCEMYLVRTEAHEQHVEGKDEFERKPLIVNGIDNTITLMEPLTHIIHFRPWLTEKNQPQNFTN